MVRTLGKFLAFFVSALCSSLVVSGQSLPNLMPFPNGTGLLETVNAGNRPIDMSGPFFQTLGTNGRSCFTCHRPAQGWGLAADEVKARFEATQGLDPLFRTNDGSNCDQNIDTSTVHDRRQAYSLLINKGLLRITMQAPTDAEFAVVGVMNPYGCRDMENLAVYRRPLPSANLRFLSAVMWDGRESSPQTGTQKIAVATNPDDLRADLAHQAMDATNGHAQGSTPLTAQQQMAIVDFEMGLTTAQAFDYRAGDLNGHGATGGPAMLGTEIMPKFFIGINDPLGGNPRGTPFTSVVFDLFDAWTNHSAHGNGADSSEAARRRASIARGQTVFNSKPINITDVAGLNDDLNLASIPGTCGTCHNSPNAGNHSVSVPLNIGVGELNQPIDLNYLPIFTLQNKTTHEIRLTTDPGRALISGLWKDIGKMKGPVLRGLSSRAPYFHNGSAGTLADVVRFYNKRFHIGLTAEEKEDLAAFLSSL